MQTFSLKFIYLLLTIIVLGCSNNKNNSVTEKEKDEAPLYSEDWKSLRKHNEAPQWFKDSKLGIYFHWGLYSVPAFDSEWYPRNMHFKDHKVYKYHVAHYGEPSEFGYHDFAPLFKAEHFNAAEWASLFKSAGAKFAGPVAEHHDGYAMWDSKLTPWDVMDTGPKRDITGELEKAIKGEGLKLITAFHHSKNLQRSTELNKENKKSHFPYFEGMPPSSDDPKLQLMYGNMDPETWYKDIWLGKMKEVIDNYQPDIIWFDYILGDIPEKYRQAFAAYYLNAAEKNNQEAVIVRKQQDLPLNMSVEDLEQSRKNTIGTKTWMTDATISDGSWCYTDNLGVKQSKDVLHMLIDITSKNGVLLLNISPKADGTIPDNQKTGLLEMGNWLHKYGESIYETEAWYTHGEGPTKEPEGHFKNHKAFHKIKYSNKDIRYTTKDYNIYAIVMGEVEPNKDILLTSFSKNSLPNKIAIKNISVLGSNETIKWNKNKDGVQVRLPSTVQDKMASVIKIVISQ